MKNVFLVFFLFVVFNLSATIINIPADQPTIQYGINISVNTDTILVQPGVYAENINFNGKSITVASLFLTTQDTFYVSHTIINGYQNGSVVTFNSNEELTSILIGFTITNGNSYYGGGISCYESSPSLENVIIDNNLADSSGGGISCRAYSSPNLINVTIENNMAGDGAGISCLSSDPSLENVTIVNNSGTNFYSHGGGIHCNHSSPSLVNVTIENNHADYGGGIWCWVSNPSLYNVRIANHSAHFGGGIYCDESYPSLTNVSVVNNFAAAYGGGIYCWESFPCLANVTIANNSADLDGGGIHCKESHPNLVNCILWNNTPDNIYFYNPADPNSVMIAYSDIQDGENSIVTNNNGIVYWEEGNIDLNPLFTDVANFDYTLQETSPCIDAGTSFFIWEDSTLVNMSEDEYFGSAPDMGAYEWQGTGVENYELPITDNQLSNYPNPFNPTTTISFSIPEESEIELSIYNIKGQKIKSLLNDQISAGEHSIVWHGEDASGKKVSSGIYLYKLNVNGKTEAVKKCLLLK